MAHADPAAELPGIAVSCDGEIAVVGAAGPRVTRAAEFFTGPLTTALRTDEIITELHIPAQGVRRAAYLKCTTGSADDWPALGVAVSFEADGKEIRAPRVVVSAATEKAIRLKGAEAVLSGATIDDALLVRAGDTAADEAETISDVRGHGRQKGHTETYRGREYSVDLLPKIKLELVLPDNLVNQVIDAIVKTASTGKIGDGKIFVSKVDEVIRIRNQERGVAAL